ncbi:MAG: peptidase M28, partial [Candidatus Sulfotelmatobacter sp.]
MKIAIAAVLALSAFAFAAEKPKAAAPEPAPAQPAVETLDLDTIGRIRDEGFHHSHVMEYASGLFDGIGPRLTGSPDFEKAEQW